MLASAFDLDNIRKTWRLQRDYNWEVMLPDMGSLPGYKVASFCQQVKFGDYGLSDVVAVMYGGYQSKFPGLQAIQDVTFTFFKPIPDIVSSYWYGWKELMIDRAGYYNVKSQYAKNVRILLYDTTGATSTEINMVGVFPKSLPSYSLAYGSERFVEISITCSVDRMSVGDYAAPQFQEDLIKPIERRGYQAEIGNAEQKAKEAINAEAFSYSTSRIFSGRANTVEPQTAAGWIYDIAKAGVGAITSIFQPSPVPDPEVRTSPSKIRVPEVIIEPARTVDGVAVYSGGNISNAGGEIADLFNRAKAYQSSSPRETYSYGGGIDFYSRQMGTAPGGGGIQSIGGIGSPVGAG